ncbi:MAG: uncharacterized protein QG636_140 [Patescibacteria group bacterium]|jgi:uncharacterized membrane protein (UPF0127 family)|nr:uncharacterized protein [Patescibacteria group bacterium]
MSIKTAIVSSILAIAILGLILFLYMKQTPLPEEKAATYSAFRFEVADSAAEHEQGLSGRTEVKPGNGLLFIFDRHDRYGFWMKDMLISIDIIWLADDGTILEIEEGVSPDTYPTPFYPPRPVKFVLETRVGEAKAQGWTVGTRIPLPE